LWRFLVAFDLVPVKDWRLLGTRRSGWREYARHRIARGCDEVRRLVREARRRSRRS